MAAPGTWAFLEGNFALLLFMASLVSGLYWLAERFYFPPQRHCQWPQLEAQDQQRRAELAKMGIAQVDGDMAGAKAASWPTVVAGLDRRTVPGHCLGVLLRSFVVGAFKIPSGSMTPTLLVGDLILVNKFTCHGLRLPVLNTKLTEGNKPQRAM